MREIKYIVIHCTDAPANQSTKEILNYWRVHNGWKDPGYHYLINTNGSYDQIFPIEKPTNGVKGYNATAIHICYKGGANGLDTRTDKQKETMEMLVRQMHVKFPKAKIKGHRDFPNVQKSCPSFEVKEWLKEIKL